MENENKLRLVSRVIVIAIALTMVLPISAVLAADAPDTNYVLLDYGNDAIPANMDYLATYGNGQAIVKVTDAQLDGFQKSGLNAAKIDKTVNPGVADIAFDFDAEPKIADNLKASADYDAHLVKFVGPVQTEWVNDLEALGAKVYKDVPEHAVLVRASDDVMDAIDDLNTVAWTGPYHPAYKIQTAVWDETENVMLSAIVFDESSVSEVVGELDNLGATINQVVVTDRTVDFTIDESMVAQVAAIPGIMEVYKDAPVYTMDTLITEVHGALDAWYPSWSGLPVAINGLGEVIGMQDSGFDIGSASNGHTDFFQGPDGDRIIRFVDQTGNSVPDGDQDGVGHGTNCAGIAIGNGWSWETWAGEPTNDYVWDKSETAGLAPRAEMSIDGVCARGGGLSPSTNYWNNQYGDGARVMTNSWGSTPADYDGTSSTVDTQMNGDTRMILFSAGNEGPYADTLGPSSQAKNGLCVAAGQNFRPEWFDSDNPNIMADFSSRGGTFSNGRIKPDIVVVGTSGLTPLSSGEVQYWIPDLQPNWYGPPPDEYNGAGGTGSDGYSDYTYFSGTSQACPAAAGLYALLRQYLRDVESIANPPSELTKAMLINGADKMDENLYEYPGYDQGWGRPNLKKSIFPNPPTTVQYDYTTLTTSADWVPSLTTTVDSSDVPLRVTLTWLDTSGVSLNRDLDLILTSPGGDVYKGNSFTTSAPYWSTPNTDANRPDDNGDADGQDHDNNVEMVWIEAPEIGTWDIRVTVDNMPSNIPCAIAMSADIGPQHNYDVLLDTDEPQTLAVVAGGQVDFQFEVTNFGSLADSILMSDDSPFTITYSPTAPFALASGESVTVVATISAGAIATGVYDFRLTGTSQGDASQFSALPLTVEVLNEPIPTSVEITSDTLDEVDPSIVTYTDASSNSHMLVSYVKTTSNGKRIFVKHADLDGNGAVVSWGPEIEPPDASGSAYESPNDPRIYVMGSGTYQDRVFIVWTGDKVGATDETASTSWITYADTSSNFDAVSDWNTVEIDQNGGANPINIKRVNHLIPLASGNQILYAWEHLDYNTLDDANPLAVDTHCRISNDGGASWGALTLVTPGDGNYYFFPNGVKSYDKNNNRDVAWIWFYWRTPTGNDRDLRVRLYDPVAGWQSGATDVWDTTDNIQFPAPISRDAGGAGYRNYCTVVRDQGTSSYTLWSVYVDGNFNAASPPASSTNGWGNAKGPFADAGKVSDANYNRRPILCMAATGDNYDWIAYMDSLNPYGIPNMETLQSNDGFNTQSNYRITTDSYAKGHQMVSSLSVGTYDNMYMVYHASRGTVLDVDYNIYLVRFHQGWETDPDIDGPIVSNVVANPNPIDVAVGTAYDISANLDETQTGFATIAAAEYWVSAINPGAPVEPTWGSVTTYPMTISGGGSPTQIETASSSDNAGGVVAGDYFYVWVRGQDSLGNWGDGDYVQVDVVGVISGLPYDISIVNPGGSMPTWRFISFPIVTSGPIETVLDDTTNGDGSTNWDIATWYDTATGAWQSYNKNFAGTNTLTTINNAMGVWIHLTVNGGDQLLTTGTVGPDPSGATVTLVAGWNLVGYPNLTPQQASSTLPAHVTKMAIYNAAQPYLIEEVPLTTTMNPDQAYWLYSTTGGDWNL